MKMVVPNIAEFHIRNITEALASNERQKHRITHILVLSVSNLENLLPFFKVKALPSDTSAWLLCGQGWIITKWNLAKVLSFFKYVD